MQEVELYRLRRFSLGMGLLVLIWTLAGVSLEQQARIAPFGLPFSVARPDLVPLGLVLATLYGVIRYFYYGLMLGPSPYRIRRDLLDQLTPKTDSNKQKIPMYWGHTHFESTPWHTDRGRIEHLAQEIGRVFPKFAHARVVAKAKDETAVNNVGRDYTIWAAEVTIPVRCRLAALFQDLDYISPVWFPLLALLVMAVRTFWSH